MRFKRKRRLERSYGLPTGRVASPKDEEEQRVDSVKRWRVVWRNGPPNFLPLQLLFVRAEDKRKAKLKASRTIEQTIRHLDYTILKITGYNDEDS